jgi:hypothetical protein
MTSLLASLVLATTMAGPVAKDTARPILELFAAESWYKEQEGKEQEFVGVLQKTTRKGGAFGFGRFNPFNLLMDKDTREVYVGGKLDILNPYVGRKVKLIGKPVDMGVEGKHHREIWPARLVVVADAGKDEPRGKDEPKGKEEVKDGKFPISARAFWPYASADPGKREKASQFVLRSAEELVRKTPFNNLDAIPAVVEKMASAALAKALKVDTIDWKTQMLVVVTGGTQGSGGFRIGVANIQPMGDKLMVEWFLQPPKGFATDAFTHPAEVVLTNRFEGPVEFRSVAPGKPPGRD